MTTLRAECGGAASLCLWATITNIPKRTPRKGTTAQSSVMHWQMTYPILDKKRPLRISPRIVPHSAPSVNTPRGYTNTAIVPPMIPAEHADPYVVKAEYDWLTRWNVNAAPAVNPPRKSDGL